MVRGRPYSGETVVATLFSQANHNLQVWLAPMLSFDWNIVVPVALIVSIITHHHYNNLNMQIVKNSFKDTLCYIL